MPKHLQNKEAATISIKAAKTARALKKNSDTFPVVRKPKKPEEADCELSHSAAKRRPFRSNQPLHQVQYTVKKGKVLTQWMGQRGSRRWPLAITWEKADSIRERSRMPSAARVLREMLRGNALELRWMEVSHWVKSWIAFHFREGGCPKMILWINSLMKIKGKGGSM